MAITKMSIKVPPVNRFTVTARALRQRGRTSDWMGPFAGLMEKNMSKSNDSSKLGRATQVRELRDDELEKVSGGLDAGKNEVAVEGAVSVELQKKHITKFKFEPTSFEFGLSHSNE